MKNPSREYLKKLSVEDRMILAKKLCVNPDYLYQLGAGIRTPSRELSIKMEMVTGGEVRESDFVDEIRKGIKAGT